MYPIVLVNWIDAAIYTGWVLSHENADLAPVSTVGYLIYEDDRRIKIAQSNSCDIRYSSIQVIPQDNIVEIIKLRRGSK